MNRLIDIARWAVIVIALIAMVPVLAGFLSRPEDPIVFLIYCGFFITALSVISSWRKQ